MIDDFHAHKGLTHMRARACRPHRQLRQVVSSHRKPGRQLVRLITRARVVCLINRKFIRRLRSVQNGPRGKNAGASAFQANLLRWGESAFYALAFGMCGYVSAGDEKRPVVGQVDVRKSLAKFVSHVTRENPRGRLEDGRAVGFSGRPETRPNFGG